MNSDSKTNLSKLVLNYHETTKHHFHRYARSAGYMDWANQPNPFRTYSGAEQIALPLQHSAAGILYRDLFGPSATPAAPLSLATIGDYLYFSMALSAWKAAGGNRWSLRVNPSSGNLHPTECYLILPEWASFGGGVCHYNVFEHAIEIRGRLPQPFWEACESHFHGAGFFVALSSIYWRESWKYGERAFRYCQLDVGHALAALAFSARIMGWRLTCLSGAGDEQIERLLGLERTLFMDFEKEMPDLVCWVARDRGDVKSLPRTLPDGLLQDSAEPAVMGRPNQLSRQAVDWTVITDVSRATRKGVTAALDCHLPSTSCQFPPPGVIRAVDVIRQRRSASAYDPRKTIDKDTFLAVLDRTLPRQGEPPFNARLMTPAINLLLFVHRVDGITPGLYYFLRTGEQVQKFVTMFQMPFEWGALHKDFPLWLLKAGDVSYDAMKVCCHQEIASHGAFAVAMLAPLRTCVERQPFFYRHLHWECGMIGQVLYLEAEAHGIRGTGIGCFFDNPVNDLLGIGDEALNSLYHFTIGHPLEDHRIQTLPAYHHIKR